MGDIKMTRKEFMRELEFLLQDISDEEREEALAFYENYFDEAGSMNESQVIEELDSPARVAAIIKDGLKGHFDEHIYAGNEGFSNDQYTQNYEVIDVDDKKTKKSKKEKKQESQMHNRWNGMDSRDRLILIVLALLACVPFSFSIFHVIGGIFGGLFGVGFSIITLFFCLIFGFWIITFIFYIASVVMIVVGIANIFVLPGAGFICIGIGFVLMALGSIFGKVAAWFFKDCIPTIINAIADGLGKIFHPRGV